MIGAFALGASLLVSTVPVPSVPVVIKLVVDEVGFQFDNDWEIIDLPLKEVSAANWSTLELAGGLASRQSAFARQDTATDLVVRAEPGASAWSVWLSSDHLRMNLTVPAKAHTRLSVVSESNGSLQMTIAGDGTFASVDTGEELQLRCNSCLLQSAATRESPPSTEGAWRLRAAYRTVSLHGAEVPALLTMRTEEGGKEVAQLASGADLRALQIDFQRTDAGSPVSAVSGPGTIAFPGLKTEPIQISAGDFLYTAPARSLNPSRSPEPLRVRRVSVGDAIEIELFGNVGELALGPSGALRSRMPTLLQYIYWNAWLQMVFGAALTLGAAVSSVLYRFGFLSKAEK